MKADESTRLTQRASRPARNPALWYIAGWTLVFFVFSFFERRRESDQNLWELIEHGLMWFGGIIVIEFTRRRHARQLAEQAALASQLRASEQRLQTAFDSAGDGLWDWNVETGEVYFSEGWCAMLGYRASEIRPHNDEWKSRIHPDDLPAAVAQVQRHMGGGTDMYQSEHRLRCKDGSYKWILDRGRVVSRDDQGRPRRMIGTHCDITARRVLEGQLQLSHDRYRFLVEGATEAFVAFRLGPDGRPTHFIEANAAACRLGEYSREALLRLDPAALESPISREEAERRAGILRSRQRLRVETEVLAQNGRRVPVEIHSELLEFEGHPTVLSVITDITERRKAERRQKMEVEQSQLLLELYAQATTQTEEELCRRVCEAAVRLTSSQAGGLYRVEGERNTMVLAHFELAPGTSGVMTAAQMAVSAGEARTVRCNEGGRACGLAAAGDTPGGVRPQRFMAVPVQGRGDSRIVAAVADKPEDYTEDELSRLQVVAAELQKVLERKWTEQALAESALGYRHLFDGNPNPMWVIERETLRFLAANEACLRLYGYAREEFLGLTSLDIRPVEERPRLVAAVKGAPHGYTFDGVWRHQKKGGEELLVEVSSQALFWQGRDARAVLIINVTERERAAARLKDSEVALKLAQRVAGVGSWRWDLRSNRIDLSEEMQRLFAVTAEEVASAGKSALARRIHPEDLSSCETALRSIAAGGEVSLEFRLQLPDGTMRHVWGESGPSIRDHEGRAQVVMGIVQDITNRKQAEMAVRSSEQRYRMLVENVAFPVTVTGLDSGKVLYANRRALDFFGVTEVPPGGAQGADYWVDPGQRLALIEELKAARVVERRECFFRPVTGEVKVAELSATVIALDGERAIFSIYADITARRKGEEALRRSEQELSRAMDLARAGTWEFDAASQTLTFNDRLYRLYATTAEREGGYVMDARRYAEEFLPPEDRGMVAAEVQKVLTATDPAKSWSLEHRIRRRDGAIRHLMVTIELRCDASGRIVGSRGVNQDITEKRETEAALRASESELDLFFNQALDGFCFMTLDEPIDWAATANKEELLDYVFAHERVTRANEAAMAQYGVTREEFIGTTPAQIMAHDLANGRELWRQLYEAGRVRAEFEARKRDGTPIWIEGDYSCLRDAAGRVIGHFGVQRDISARKRAEADLVRSREQLAQAMAMGRMAGWEYDLASQMFTFNAPFYQLLGTAAADEGGYLMAADRYLREFTFSEEAAVLAAHPERIAATKKPGEEWEFEHMVRRRDGDIRHMHVRITPLSDATGTMVAARGVNTDITERKQAEEALRLSEERFRGIVHSSTAGYFRIDAHGCYASVNPAWLSMHGYARAEEVVGRHFSISQTEQDVDAAAELIRHLLAGNKVPPGEMSHRCRDGSTGYHTFSCQPVRVGPVVQGAEGFLIDTTPLRRAREDFRMLFERMIDGFAVHEILCNEAGKPIDYRFLAVNPAFERQTGLKAASVLGRTAREILPALEELWIERYGKVALTGEPVSFIEYAAALDRHFEVSAFRPAPNQFACILVDVTARRKSELEVRKLARAVEQSPAVVMITSPQGEIEYVNSQFTRVTGYTLDEVKGRTPRILKSGQQAPAVYVGMWATILAGREWRGELCNRRKDGSFFWEETTISPVLDENGKIAHFLGIKEDVTARRATLMQVREQAALLSVTRDAIILVDLENRVRFWNRGAEGIYGWTAEEAVGSDLYPLVYDEAHPAPRAARDAIVQSGEWSGELRHRTKAGGTVVVRARGVLMRDEGGAPRSILLTATDLTDAKRLEALLQRAQRLESIGSLASGVAHDLNNVLSPIMMSVELLRPLAVTPQDREVLRLMSDSVRRGADVVRQLLFFGRGSDTPGSLVDIGKVVKEILRMVRETFPRSLEIAGQAPTDLWPVRGHATQIYQVLLNLCVNARDAMPTGGRLTFDVGNRELTEDFVRKYPESRSGRFVELAVIDTGTGIEPGIVDRIFDPFFSTKEQGKGTGLGLSTAIGIVRNHNGFITVDSQLGAGSAFRVFLPAAELETTSESPDRSAQVVPGRGETVLVVDDEEGVRQVLSRALTSLGYRTLTAASGSEALRLTRDHRGRVGVAVLDMMMGGVDGLSLVTRIREVAPDLPLIACSGLERYRAELAALGWPQLHFLRKPFTTVQISEMIRAVLDGRTPSGSSAPF